MLGPQLHEVVDRLTRRVTERLPQVLSHGILVLELFQIVVQTVSESLKIFKTIDFVCDKVAKIM